MSTNNANGRIEAELNIENFDSEDSDEKLEIVFNRKRDIPCQQLINQEFVEQESLNTENHNDDETNNEYTDEDGRMAVEFNVNLMPLRTSQLENDAGFQTGEEVQEDIEEHNSSEDAHPYIQELIESGKEELEEEISKKVETVDGSDFLDVSRENSTVTIKSKTYVFEQGISSNRWIINYDLTSKRPTVDVVDSSGSVQIPDDINYGNNTITLTFLAAFSGKAYLN